MTAMKVVMLRKQRMMETYRIKTLFSKHKELVLVMFFLLLRFFIISV